MYARFWTEVKYPSSPKHLFRKWSSSSLSADPWEPVWGVIACRNSNLRKWDIIRVTRFN